MIKTNKAIKVLALLFALTLVLALSIILGTALHSRAAVAERHIWINADLGDDTFGGFDDPTAPFVSLEGALTALQRECVTCKSDEVKAIIHIDTDIMTMSNYDPSKTTQGNNSNFDCSVKVVGSNGGAIGITLVGTPKEDGTNPVINIPSYATNNAAYYLNNSYTFENITIKFNYNAPRLFLGGSCDVVVNEGTKIIGANGLENASLVVSGITNTNVFSGARSITINYGTFSAILGGAARNGTGNAMTTTITINGGTVTNVGYTNYACDGYSGAKSDTIYNINGGTITNFMTGQTHAASSATLAKTYDGKVTVNMTGGRVNNFYGHGGSDTNGTTTKHTTYHDDVTINITGGDIGNFIGLRGLNKEATLISGKTTVNISGDVYIEQYTADPVSSVTATVTGTYTANVSDEVHLNQVRPVTLEPVEYHAVLDGVNGNDETAQLESYDFPFQSLEGALIALKAACAGTPSSITTAHVYVVSDAYTIKKTATITAEKLAAATVKGSTTIVGSNKNFQGSSSVINGSDSNKCPVYITGVPSGGVNPTLKVPQYATNNSAFYFDNNYIFENVTVSFCRTNPRYFMNAAAGKTAELVINQGTKFLDQNGKETAALIATGITAVNKFSGTRNITVNDGTFAAVVAGVGQCGAETTAYNSTITINGGTITTVGYSHYAGGGYSGAKATITYNINGGKITNLMTGSTNASGNKTYFGKSVINMTGGDVTNFYGHGGTETGGTATVHTTYADEAEINVSGGTIGTFYGAYGVSVAGTEISGKTDVTIGGSTEIGRYAGPRNITLSGEYNLTIDNVTLTAPNTKDYTDVGDTVFCSASIVLLTTPMNITINGGDFTKGVSIFAVVSNQVNTAPVKVKITGGGFGKIIFGGRAGGAAGYTLYADITGGTFETIVGGSVGGSPKFAYAIADADAGVIDYAYSAVWTFGGTAHVTGNVYAQAGGAATAGGLPVKATFTGGVIDGNLYASGQENASTVNSNATYNVSTITLDGVKIGGDYVAGSASSSTANLLHENGTIHTIVKGDTVVEGKVIVGHANPQARAQGKFILDLEGGTVGSVVTSEGSSNAALVKISTVSGDVNIKSGAMENSEKLDLYVIPGDFELGLGKNASLTLSGLYNADLEESTLAVLRLKEIETWESGTAYLALPNSYSSANVTSVPVMSNPLVFTDSGTSVIWQGAGASAFSGIAANSLIMNDILSVRYYVSRAEVDAYIEQNGFWSYTATIDGKTYASATFRSVAEAENGMEVKTAGGTTYYTFIVTGVSALSYEKQIKVEMPGAPVDSISVNELLMQVIEGPGFSAEFVRLAKALYNYGIATCNRFSVPSTLTPFEDIQCTKDYPTDYSVKNEGKAFSFYGTSLTFGDSIRMNYYGFLADGADLSDMQFTVNGVAVPASALEISTVSGRGYNTRISFAISVRGMAEYQELALLDANGALVASINDSIAGACAYYIENESADAELAANVLAYVQMAEEYFNALA